MNRRRKNIKLIKWGKRHPERFHAHMMRRYNLEYAFPIPMCFPVIIKGREK